MRGSILAENWYFVYNEAENECRQKCINSFNFTTCLCFIFYLFTFRFLINWEFDPFVDVCKSGKYKAI